MRYQELLDLNSAVDFDDLLMRTVELLGRAPSVLEYYQERFLHLLVDEFQDTNVAQYELSKLDFRMSIRISAWWATRTSPSTRGVERTHATP